MINGKSVKSLLEELVYAEFGDQLDKKDEEIELLTKKWFYEWKDGFFKSAKFEI